MNFEFGYHKGFGREQTPTLMVQEIFKEVATCKHGHRVRVFVFPETSNSGKLLLPLVLKAQGEELALQEASERQELESRRATDSARKCSSLEEDSGRTVSLLLSTSLLLI